MIRHRLLFIVLGLCLVFSAPAGGAVLSAELRVNGISCPFCAFGIEKKLLEVAGVEGVEIFLDDGRIAVTFEPDNSVTLGDLEKAVEKAGFELAGVTLTVQGRLLAAKDAGARLVSGARMTLRLVENRGDRSEPLSTVTLERLRASVSQEDGSIVIAGVVTDWGECEPTLTVKPVAARKP